MVDQIAPRDSRNAQIARIAAGQHGVITQRQLLGCELTKAAISKRVRSGRLRRVHRGVYLVGGADLSDEARWMAAVLACGNEAVLSHASAAALWGLLRPLDGPVDVSVPVHSGRAQREGIRIHRRSPVPRSAVVTGVRRSRRPPSTTASP